MSLFIPCLVWQSESFCGRERGWGFIGQEVPRSPAPQPAWATSKSLGPPPFGLLPGKLYSIPRAQPVIWKMRPYFVVLQAQLPDPHRHRPAPITGKTSHPSLFLFFCLLLKAFGRNYRFFLKDCHFVPTAVNETKGKENRAGAGGSEATHPALAPSAESSWLVCAQPHQCLYTGIPRGGCFYTVSKRCGFYTAQHRSFEFICSFILARSSILCLLYLL